MGLSIGSNGPVNATLTASELHLGKIGGEPGITAEATPVITTAGTPYAAGDLVGTKLTFANAARLAGGSGMAMMAALTSKAVQTVAVDLVLFHTNPTATTFTDNAAFDVATADLDKILDVISLSDWRTIGTKSFCRAPQLALPFSAAAGSKDLYGALVARGVFTIAAAGDQKAVLKVLPD